LSGLDCPSCAAKVERSVQRLDGVVDVRVDFLASTISLEYRPDGAEPGLYGRVKWVGDTAALLEAGCVPVYAASDHNEPSIRTATSVGYVQYAWQFRVQVARQGGCRS